MTKGTDNQPKTVVEMMRILNEHKVLSRLQQVQEGNGGGLACPRPMALSMLSGLAHSSKKRRSNMNF